MTASLRDLVIDETLQTDGRGNALRNATPLRGSTLARYFADHRNTFDALEILSARIEAVANCIMQSLRAGRKLMLCGNGGSAADCQHIAAEFTGRFCIDRRPLPAIALTTDTSALTCIANDYAFESVFARQVLALGAPGDCLVGISTSGNSANVLAAVRTARMSGVTAIGLLGRDGGNIVNECDEAVVVPGDDTARIQEAHIFIGHAWCGLVEAGLFPR